MGEDLETAEPGEFDGNDPEWEYARIPEYTILNGEGMEMKEQELRIVPEDGLGVITMSRQYNGELSEFMELELFPLDFQDLSFVVRLKDPDRKFKVLSGLEYKRIRETVELAEWYAFEPTTCGSMNEYGRTLYTV